MAALYVSLFISVSLLTYVLVILFTAKRSHIQNRIETYFPANDAPFMTKELAIEEDVPFFQRVMVPLWDGLKRRYRKHLNYEEATMLETKLLQAGLSITPVGFKMFQLTISVSLVLMGLGYGLLINGSIFAMILCAGIGAGAAAILPRYYLKTKTDKRSRQAVRELPDMLDLLTISLEAGLGFDAALSQVVAKKSGILSDEFNLCLEEMRLGKTRKEALTSITDRIKSEEIRSLIFSINQAEKLGIGMVSVLRVQTEDIRDLRKQKAEEKAMKAPIKMMFPLVMFIFPTLFIILLGPAILQLMESF